MRAMLLALLTACAAEPSLIPDVPPPPPRSITLRPWSAPVAGGPWYLRVTGLPPGASVEVHASDDTVSPGWCPPVLTPACVDLADAGYLLGHGRADGAGAADLRVVLPSGAPTQFEVMAWSWHRGAGYASPGVVVDALPAGEDPDGDTLTNLDEARFGSDPLVTDTDGDGLRDDAERLAGTLPRRFDSDDDGLSDPDELVRGTDPRDADTDDDTLRDGAEVHYGTDPLSDDTDGDLLKDGDEVAEGLDPRLPDTDGDGLDDFVELVRCIFAPACADPLVPDTDGDTLLDGEEDALGTSPTDRDTDNDGLDDTEGRLYGTDPRAPDTDLGSVLDGDEVRDGTDPLAAWDDPGSLRVNEVDVDNPGRDRAEFIELFNPGNTDVPLDDVAVVLVDGATGLEYARYPLTGVASAGAYLLVAGPDVVAPAGTPLLALIPAVDAIQHARGDGVAVVHTATFEVLDSLVWEGQVGDYTLAGFPNPVDLVEGDAATAVDLGSGDEAIARIPNGVDHNNAATDFATRAPTPGAAN